MAFIATGLLVWITMAPFWAFVLRLFGTTADPGLIGVGFRVSDFLGIATGIATAMILWRHERVNTLAHEIAYELKKVTWPTWEETKVSTLVVVVVTSLIALILGAYDAVWAFLTGLIYGV
jgi:preprotein translocase subunit SecE